MTAVPCAEPGTPRHRLSAFAIGATFVGTTIGAGYASGQEILQYFVSFGMVGLAALGIAGSACCPGCGPGRWPFR